jgi:hypothetical protein
VEYQCANKPHNQHQHVRILECILNAIFKLAFQDQDRKVPGPEHENENVYKDLAELGAVNGVYHGLALLVFSIIDIFHQFLLVLVLHATDKKGAPDVLSQLGLACGIVTVNAAD